MLKVLLFFTCVIAYCSAAVIKDIQPEELNAPGNAVEENNENQSDLETAEFKHIGFGPKVVVINKGYGGHGGYGGYGGSRGCGCGGYGGRSHYHSHHRYYGKKK